MSEVSLGKKLFRLTSAFRFWTRGEVSLGTKVLKTRLELESSLEPLHGEVELYLEETSHLGGSDQEGGLADTSLMSITLSRSMLTATWK